MIKPYLSDIINDHKKWEIQLTMQINFIYFKRFERNSYNTYKKWYHMMGSETNDLIEELFESLQKHQEISEKNNENMEICFW